ncbi:MAG: type II secretion system F family protein [Deltaproteobacteria bacterium]|uniref:type II secretion system F family protein n=1 Tax=Desulfobacula sp. TaxID=2593537 RepID=UPI00199DF718|nr:type II secretion system F family protein [Candidatus Desulfobacula maris]MBL6994098.1 type II secretion system F family protein [Desulfobacula sp.]
MAIFKFKALNEHGHEISGEIEAETKKHAMELISLKGNIPESVKKKAGASSKKESSKKFEDFFTSVKPKDLVLYSMSLKTLIQAGVSIIQTFQILEKQTENQKLRSVTVEMVENISQGASLYDAFSKHRKIFNNLYLSMIKAGELSGTLPNVLDRLIYILEHEEKVRSDIKSAIRYPIIVVFFLIIAFFVLLTFVIPKFAAIFANAGLDLPLPTQICVGMYSLLQNYWQYMLLFSAGFIFLLFRYIKTEKGLFMKDLFLIKTPLIGPLFLKAAMSRFGSIFSILQASGVSVLDSFKILAETINNNAITKEFEKIQELLVEGRGISMPLRQAKYFTPMVVNMISIGEESGNLDSMLQEIAKHYDIEVEYATKNLSDALGPILIVGLAAVVGFFAISIFLPMWDLTKMV